jgi:hypothetical protein
VTNVDGGDGAQASAQGGGSIAAWLRDAQELLRVENYEGALELYQAAASLDPARVGRTSFDELLSVSGMGPFEALRIFASLVDARIVGVAA